MRPQFPQTDIYALTDSGLSLGRSTLDVAQQMLLGGVKLIQYREKHLSSGAMLAECLALRDMTRQAGCSFVVNDHVDIAMLCKADGIHVGQDDLPLSAVRSLVGESMYIGVSVRNAEEVAAALEGGADYLGVGAVFPTATKEDAVMTGLAFLENVLAMSPIPVAAIGGINEKTIATAARAGATCFALISAITQAPDIPAKIAKLRALIKE